MALILLVSALALGAALTHWIRIPLYPFEAVALTVVLGLFCWTWLAFLLALVLPYSGALPLAVLAGLGAGVALRYSLRARPPRWRPLEGGRRAWIGWGAATAATVLLLGRLFWTHSLTAEPGGIYTGGSTWADFGLHASIITHLAAPDRMPLDLPVASGARLTYPFLIDLTSALLHRGGWSLHASLFVPGVLLALAICQLVIGFSLRLFGSVAAAVGGLALVLFTGTAAGTTAAWQDWRDSGEGLATFLAAPPKDYTVLGDRNGNVTNFVANALLPQRAMLFGAGVGLAVFVLLAAYRQTGALRPLFGAGVLVGLLPMGHAHSFLVGGVLIAALALEQLVLTRRVPWPVVAAGGTALVLAVPQLIWQRANGGTGGRVRLGWMVQPGESIWSFWAVNFGLAGLLFVALPVVLVVRRPWRRHLAWYLPFLAILAVTQVYAFQPFEYDNLKLLYYVYLMAFLLAAWLAVLAYRRSRWTAALLVPLALFVSLPGLLSIGRELRLHDQFASPADVALADWARTRTAPDEVFLGTDRPNVPVATLAGRAVVMGYRGWLFNFSIRYDDRDAAVRAALAGHVDDPAVRRFAPDYLVVGGNEGDGWLVDRAALARLPIAYSNAEWTVYRLTGGVPGGPPAGSS